MRIVFICRLYWPHRGGVEKHVELLSAELKKRGHKIIIIAEQFDSELPLEESRNGIKIIRLPYFALTSKRAVWTWMERQLPLVDAADVVHIHDVWWWYAPLLIMRPLKRFFITNHGYEGIDAPQKKAIFIRKIGEKLSSGTICIGDFMRKWYLAAPKIVSYGAATVKPAKYVNNKSAVFFGRFDYDTGFDIYWRAALIMKHMHVDFFGEGRLASEDFVKPSRRLIIKPWANNPEKIYQHYRYAFVSRYLAILEAMQAKRLVVAVYNNEIKKDYLLCHPMRDAMVIAGGVGELKNEMERLLMSTGAEERMVERAYSWAKHQTWKKLADEYLELWR